MTRIILIALCAMLLSGCAYSPARLALAASANTRQCIHPHNHIHTGCQQSAAPAPTAAPSAEPSCTQPEDIFNEMNATRKKYGLSVLTYNTELERGAFIRAKEVSANFSHYRPDGSPCTTVSEVADGEIIARVSVPQDAPYIIEGWLDSPPHREAILRNCDMEMGAGYYVDECTGAVAWSVLFHLV